MRTAGESWEELCYISRAPGTGGRSQAAHQDHMRKFKTTNYFRENRALDGLHEDKVTVPNPRKTTPKVRDHARQQPSLYQDSETSVVVAR